MWQILIEFDPIEIASSFFLCHVSQWIFSQKIADKITFLDKKMDRALEKVENGYKKQVKFIKNFYKNYFISLFMNYLSDNPSYNF